MTTLTVNGLQRESTSPPTTPLLDVLQGRAVTTIEGLQDHPIIAALIAEQAGQCGYCLSGMAVAAAALLARNASPTRAEIAAALDAQLCRCGAHPRILRAVERAAREAAR
jgi:nicotinate dehydrogenase subunit A